MMSFWGAPFRPVQDRAYLGLLEASGPSVAQWVVKPEFAAQMASLFPASTAAAGAADTQAVLLHEYAARSQCHEAFAAVARFEGSHSLQLASMGTSYLAQVGRGLAGAGVGLAMHACKVFGRGRWSFARDMCTSLQSVEGVSFPLSFDVQSSLFVP